MGALASSVGHDGQLRARRGLAIYFAVLLPLSAAFEGLVIMDNLSWVWVLMWTPAAASVVARLILHEGFADVSFRVGGRRGWKAIVLALIFPIVIGLISYGTAWATGLVQFSPQPFHFITHYVPENASPVVTFVINLAAASTFMTVFSLGTAAGEEIGWRGFMLTRLIDAGVPNPILMSGLIWASGMCRLFSAVYTLRVRRRLYPCRSSWSLSPLSASCSRGCDWKQAASGRRVHCTRLGTASF